MSDATSVGDAPELVAQHIQTPEQFQCIVEQLGCAQEEAQELWAEMGGTMSDEVLAFLARRQPSNSANEEREAPIVAVEPSASPIVVAHHDGQPELHDVELERKALGACIQRPEFLLQLELQTSDFWVESHQVIWRVLQWLYAEHGIVNILHLHERLAELNKLKSVGGLDYLTALTDTIPEALPPTRRLRELAQLRALRERSHQVAVLCERGDLNGALALTTRTHSEVASAGRPSALASAWRTLGEWGALSTPPAPRRWLLNRPDEETNGMANPVGVLPLGKTGLLVAPGGVGKTLALVQLALAVAAKLPWFNYFGTPNPGRVLLALAEEDAEEIGRRIYTAARAMRLTLDQERLAAANIVALPLAGISTALVESDAGTTMETALLADLRRKLGESEWRLIILDPLSRFAGGDTEKDNAAATRFVQVAESLTKVPGSPTVLIAHHTNKLSRGDESRASAANARGASGLIDGVRLVANLESVGSDGARLTLTKSNYGSLGAPVELVRDFDHGGFLRVMTSEESRRRAEAVQVGATNRATGHPTSLHARICATLGTQPDMSKAALAKMLGVRPEDVGHAVDKLVEAGTLTWGGMKRGYKLTPGSSRALPASSQEDLAPALPSSSQLFPEECSAGLPALPTPLGGEEGKSWDASNGARPGGYP